VLIAGKFRDRHILHRKDGVRAVHGRHRHPRNLREAKVVGGRLLWPVQQFLAIDDLQETALVGSVAKVDAIAGWTGRDRSLQFGLHRDSRARRLDWLPDFSILNGVSILS